MRLQGRSVWSGPGGYTRIQGALANLGHDVGLGTIAGILKGAGVETAPERGKGTRWAEFSRIHWAVLEVYRRLVPHQFMLAITVEAATHQN